LRFQWREYSFELPSGFEIQPDYSPDENQNPDQTNTPPGKVSESTCMTICKPASPPPSIFPISENPDDLNPAAAPVTIALTSIPVKYVGPPLRHLQQSTRVLPEYLNAFRVTTCEPYQVGNHEAARVHFSFETNFRIDQFIIAWHVDAEIVTTTMTIPECDPETGWQILLPLVESFRSG